MERLKEIKRSFRLYMNGVTAQSMREKGVDYHLIWGVSLQHLQMMAAEYGKDYELACLLWKENIRECKLLATMIMPLESFSSDLAMLWVSQIPTIEVAEHLVLNLLSRTDYALDLAFQLMAERDELPRICAFNLITRLLIEREQRDGRDELDGNVPLDLSPRDRDELTDQIQSALESDSLPLRLAASKARMRLPED